VLLAAVTGGVALAAPSGSTAVDAVTPTTMRITPAAARALGPQKQIRGMALNDQLAGRSLVSTIPDFPHLKALGVNSVAIYVYLYVHDPKSTEVITGPNTASDSEITTTIDAARQQGLGVQLHPVMMDLTTLTWRGSFQPTSVSRFFSSYTTQLVHYAQLGQAHGANLFYVGSELNNLVKYTTQWRAVIKTVRRHFSGALAYMSNIRVSAATKVWFYDALDFAGLAPYYYMHWKPTPSYDDFRRAWTGYTTGTGAIAKWLYDLPIPLLYSEIGYHSQERSFVTPYAAGKSARDLPAPQAQADAYRALIDVLNRTRGVKGVTFWAWAPGTKSPADTGFSPAGKPAECVMARAWSTDPTVRSLLNNPGCNLSALDAALLKVSEAAAQ
jgi:hypothetical protein